MKQRPPKPSNLYVTVLSWKKDSYGLFDYQSTREHTQKQAYQIQGPCKLYRNWHNAQTCVVSNAQIKKGEMPKQSYSFHASVTLKHNGNYENFILGTPEKPSQQMLKRQNTEEPETINTNSYLVVKDFKDSTTKVQGYPLKQGDVFKLGRVQFRTMEIGGKKWKGKKQQSFLKQFEGLHIANEEVNGTCKFCLCDEVTQDNFLISPCNCKGSCEVVHVECLKMWINSKIKKEVVGIVTTYNFSKFQCQLCKEPFPRKVLKGELQKEMLDIEKPDKPYIMIENINERKQSKDERCLHFLCPQESKPVKMGRGHQCQIRLQDISVSRMHSQIKYEKGEFYLTDQNSKFGTLVRLDHPLQLHQKSIKIQAGRSLYDFVSQ